MGPWLGDKEVWDPRLPDKNVDTIMRKALPDNAKISHDAKDKITRCATELILFVTSEAADRRAKEPRSSTITGKDIIDSFFALGFEHYAKFLEELEKKIAKESGEKEPRP